MYTRSPRVFCNSNGRWVLRRGDSPHPASARALSAAPAPIPSPCASAPYSTSNTPCTPDASTPAAPRADTPRCCTPSPGKAALMLVLVDTDGTLAAPERVQRHESETDACQSSGYSRSAHRCVIEVQEAVASPSPSTAPLSSRDGHQRTLGGQQALVRASGYQGCRCRWYTGTSARCRLFFVFLFVSMCRCW